MNNKCPEARKEECKGKNKVCNPKTGRCIKPKIKKPQRLQQESEESEPSEEARI